MRFNERKRYSIRKTLLGVGSIVIGSLIGVTPIYAQETSAPTNEVVQQPIVTVEEIDSPIRYQEDNTQPVGYRHEQPGTKGSITYTTVNGVTTQKRVEPTETVITLGTQPVVTESETDTEYVKTETTYKIETITTTDKKVPEIPVDEPYRYINESFWHKDTSKELPSDQIVIDKLFVTQAGDLEAMHNMPESEKSVREKIVEKNENGHPYLKDTVNDSVSNGVIVPIELLAPEDGRWKDVDTLWNIGGGFVRNQHEYEEIVGQSNTGEIITEQVKNHEIVIFRISYLDLFKVAAGQHLREASVTTEKEALEQYTQRLEISDALYADIKADWLRMVATYEKAKEQADNVYGYVRQIQQMNGSDEPYTPELYVDRQFEVAKQWFERLTHDYNVTRSGRIEPTVDFSKTTSMQEWYTNIINKIPKELRQNLVNVVVTDEKIELSLKNYQGEFSHANGVASSQTSLIKLYNFALDEEWQVVDDPSTGLEKIVEVTESQQNNESWKRKVLLHEMAHLIDFNSGVSENLLVEPTDYGKGTYFGFSQTPEWGMLYEQFIKNNKLLGTHYQNYRTEAFADGFARYLNKRLFNDDMRYILRQNEEGKDVIIRVSPGDKYYDEGVNPFEPTFPYFERLYNALVGTETTQARVVVDEVRTTRVAKSTTQPTENENNSSQNEAIETPKSQDEVIETPQSQEETQPMTNSSTNKLVDSQKPQLVAHRPIGNKETAQVVAQTTLPHTGTHDFAYASLVGALFIGSSYRLRRKDEK